MNKRAVFIVILIIIVVLTVKSMVYSNSNSKYYINREITSLDYPIQSEPDTTQPIILKHNNYTIQIIPKAGYQILAQVVSKKNYNNDWDGDIIPVDLALSWGNVVDNYAQNHIKFTQFGRWYYFRYDKDYPYTMYYIYTHSANNHIVPANENIKNAVKSIQLGDKIYLDGYLIDLSGKSNGKEFLRHSSLSRNDTGAGSCEIIYVKKLQIGNKVYT